MSLKNNIVKKAIIPVAGLGTRMLPATKAIPKEMLPLVDKPLIQYLINECMEAGIFEIIFITHSSKNSIENHFDTSFELEAILEKRVKRKLLNEVQTICPKGVTIMQVRQGVAKGLGHAIMCAYSIVGDNPVAIILPDVILDKYSSNFKKDNLYEMLKKFHNTGISQIMVKSIPYNDVVNYGIVDCKGYNLKPGESTPIINIIEKPTLNTAPSNLAIVGRYVLSANIWPLLEKTPLGKYDEIQLTDSIKMLIQQVLVEAYHLKGVSYDCGSKLGYMKAFVQYGMNHTNLGKDFSQWLQQLIITIKK
ncbi:UTP--glucose-1-phosphate uridylyltransferase [Serratia symbiotica]|nr:UTP--glucose-1-phosphate uridylyltransferase [Serratia symbiotica]